MNKKVPVIIGITAFVVGFAVAVLFLVLSVPYVFSSCGREKPRKEDITAISVEILSANGDTVYSCDGDYGSISLKPDTDYTVKLSSVAYHYGNPNGMVGFGYLLLNYGDLNVSFDNENMSLTEMEQESEKIDYPDRSGYFNLEYTLRGTECSDKTFVVDYSAEFKAGFENYSFTPCTFKVSFAC